MTAVAVDFLVLLLAGACLWGTKYAWPPLRSLRADYLSGESCRGLRGLLSLGILLHHLGQKGMGLVLMPLLSKIGFLLVAVFFFLSGYGLMKQHMAKPDYRRTFPRRRLPAIILPYALATGLYWLLYWVLGTPWSGRAVLRGLVDGSPIVTASWYVLCVLLFYLAFWCLMWLWGRRFRGVLAGAVVFMAGYVALCRWLGYGSWWYNTAPALVLGMAWALYQEKIDGVLSRHISRVFPGTFLLFLGTYGGKILLNPLLPSTMAAVSLTWPVSGLFVCCVVLGLTQVSLEGPLLRWLGDISLETYLVQFLFLQLLRSDAIRVENDLAYALLVLVGTLGFAWAMHQLDRWLLRILRK